MGEKRIKQLKRQMPLRDGLRAQAYFHDMAAEGRILDEIGYLYYYFREEEPRDIRYATQVYTEFPPKELLAEYAAKGWKEVGHWDTQFVFATEDPQAEELFDHREIERLEVEQKIMEIDRKLGKGPDFYLLALIVIAFGAAVYYNGFRMESLLAAAGEVWHWIAIFLFGFVVNFFHKRKLLQKKQEMEEQRQQREEGRWDDSDTQWRGKWRRNTAFIGLLVLAMGLFVFYAGNLNEKTLPVPEEISYAALPALRIEALQAGDWLPMGESIDMEKEGIQLNQVGYELSDYRTKKSWGELHNYTVEYRFLPHLERKVFLTETLQEETTGESAKQETLYIRYRLEGQAKQKFAKEDENNMGGSGIYIGEEAYWRDGTVEWLDVPKGNFDDLHVCRVTSQLGERIHILARYGRQFMEVKYSGTAETEEILTEMEKVFAAQMEK